MPTHQTDKATRRTALLKLCAVLLVGLAAGAGMFIATLRSTPQTATRTGLTPEALNGLIDQEGKAFNAATLQGHYTLVYFGFTFCPDACPTALYNLTLAMQRLDSPGRVQPVFVSVDPARDTPDKMNDYLTHFSDAFIGLTGSPDAIGQVENSFGVIAVEHRDERLPGGYTMDHSNEFLLFSPNGRLIMRIPADTNADNLTEQLRGLTRADAV